MTTEIEKDELRTCLAAEEQAPLEIAATDYPAAPAALVDLAKAGNLAANYGAAAMDRAWLLENRAKLATWGLSVDGAAAASLHWFPLFLKANKLEPEYRRLVTAAVEKRGIIPFLGRVRTLLKTKGTIPKALRQGFAKALKATFPGVKPKTLLRFTPSSNVAELPLLDATSAHAVVLTCLADLQSQDDASACEGRTGQKPVTLDAVLRRMWTALYDDVEFGERLRQGVDPFVASMGFVVEPQPAPGRLDGVAVTASLYGASDLVQSGVSLALLPTPKVPTDLDPAVLPASAYVLDGELKLNRRSSLIPAGDALPPARLLALAGALEKLEETYMLDRALSPDDYALELRFRVTAGTPDVTVESLQPILLKK